MRYKAISKELFEVNRKSFCSSMTENSIAVFCSNDQMPTNSDGTMPFKQNSDLFWLSGVDQEESKLVLFPNCSNPNHREILFLKETSEKTAIVTTMIFTILIGESIFSLLFRGVVADALI